jgi:hypothetical protein
MCGTQSGQLAEQGLEIWPGAPVEDGVKVLKSFCYLALCVKDEWTCLPL